MEGRLLTGWARRDITPALPTLLAGQFYRRVATEARDSITATAFALESVGPDGRSLEQAILVSCDLLLVERELQYEFRRLLSDRLPGFNCRKAFLFATHIHTGPFTSEDELSKFGSSVIRYPADQEGVTAPAAYAKFLAGRLCDAAAEAWNGRAPGSVSRAYALAAIGYNRMVTYADGSARMYGPTDVERFNSFVGPSDPGVEMLFVWDGNGTLTGVAVNVACPSQIVEHKGYVSADFWGEVRNELVKRYGREIFVLAMTGAAGDQSPRDLVRRQLSFQEMNGEEGLFVVAGRIADAVDAAYKGAKQQRGSCTDFRHAVVEIDLPIRRVTEEEAERSRAEYERILCECADAVNTDAAIENPSEEALFHLAIEEAVFNRYCLQQENPYFKVEIHGLRIGDVAIATNPFELYLDYGLQIKARCRALQTFVVELACDCGLYLPTERAVAGGGYSAQVCNGFVGPEGGRMLVERTVEMLNGLMDEWP